MPSGAAALPARELTARRRPDATASRPTPAVAAVCSSSLFDPFRFTRANATTRAGLCVRRAASRATTASLTRPHVAFWRKRDSDALRYAPSELLLAAGRLFARARPAIPTAATDPLRRSAPNR